MFPIDVRGSSTARRISLRVTCPKCGHKSSEPLSRFQGRYKILCRGCEKRIIDLQLEKNRVVIEKLAQFCLKVDATLSKREKLRH